MSDVRVVPVARLDVSFAPRVWPFAEERRTEIATYFDDLRRARPALWNGRVLMLDRFAVAAEAFEGRFFETDFASFLAWRDWGAPDDAVRNGFAAGALRTQDGAYLLGVMGAHTANAGLVYFPSGTPEPRDIVGDRVALEDGLTREIAEETGLGPNDFDAAPGWIVAFEGPRIGLIKVLAVHGNAEAVRARIRTHLAREAAPELADVRIVRGPGDLDPMMPRFVPAVLGYLWR
jgi:hypothetical protein